MKTVLKIALPLLLLAGGLTAKNLLVATGPEVQDAEPEGYVPVVEVLEVHPQTVRLDVNAQGEARALRTVALTAEAAGTVLEVGDGLLAGAFFARGELLLRLDDTDARIAVLSAQARVEQARAALELEQAQAEIARRDWEALGRGEAPPAALREPQRRAAEAELAAAAAALRKAEVDLARCTVVAPFDGRTLRRAVEPGGWIAPGQPLAEVYDTAAAEVVLPLPLEQLAFLDLDVDGADTDPVTVTLSADIGGQPRHWQGEVSRVDAALDPRDRMVRAIARVEAPFRSSTGALTPGMFVQATLHGRSVDGVFRVPRHVLRPGDRLLVVDADSRLREIEVDVLQRRREEILVSGGLQAGARVCLTTLALVIDGMPVEVAAAEDAQ